VAHWSEFEVADPELAASVGAILKARKHHTLATLRQDGSPRVSGIEVAFVAGDLVLGMMPQSRKLADVRRDARVGLHALSDDPPAESPQAWRGDVKLSGLAVELPADPSEEPEGPRFWLDIGEVVLTHLDASAQHLLVESWHPGRGHEVHTL
jgi:hypothetical protein